MKFSSSIQDTNGASNLAQMLDKLSQSNCDITVVGNMACKALMNEASCVSVHNMIENAAVVWEFLKRRTLPGLMALDRVRFLYFHVYKNSFEVVAIFVVEVGSSLYCSNVSIPSVCRYNWDSLGYFQL